MPRPVIQRIVEDPEDARRHSTYFITISSNYRPENENDQVIVENMFYDALAQAFQERLEYMLKWRRGFHPELFLAPPQIRIRVETGGHLKGSRVHAHVILHIEHTTNIQLDYHKLKHEIMEQILSGPLNSKVHGVYIHFELLRNEQEAREKYMKKKNKIVQQSQRAIARRNKNATRNVRLPRATKPRGRV